MATQTVSIPAPRPLASPSIDRRTRGRVLLVSPQPFYEDRGTPIAVELVARTLGSLGFHVDLLAFPIGQDVDLPGVTVHRSARLFGITAVPIGFSAGKLALDAGLFGSFARLLDSGDYDVVHAVEEAAYLAAMLCPSRGVPFIYDMASAIPVEVERHPLLGSRVAQSVLRSVERNVLGRAAHVVCSQGLGERVRELAPLTPVSEWRFPIPDLVSDRKSAASLRGRMGISRDEHVVLYAGNFSRYQGLDLLIEAFTLAARRHSELTLCCVGAPDAASASRWRDRLPEDVRPRARVVPRVPRQEVSNYLAMADTLVSLRPEGDNAPLKMFEYMAAGRPILATRGRAHEPVLTAERAVLCDCDAEDIASGLSDLMRDPQKADRVSRSAQGFAQREYGREQFEDLLLDVYEPFERYAAPWWDHPRPLPSRRRDHH
jgi:glycosyltransferase involved in cell wall biosynthesis